MRKSTLLESIFVENEELKKEDFFYQEVFKKKSYNFTKGCMQNNPLMQQRKIYTSFIGM